MLPKDTQYLRLIKSSRKLYSDVTDQLQSIHKCLCEISKNNDMCVPQNKRNNFREYAE